MEAKTAANPESFYFRGLHPGVSIGTASDRYAGWIGQIYSADRYSPTRRVKRVGGKSFEEQVLPVACVREYFEHFEVLEVDFTFYSLLLDEKGSPARVHHVLRSYRDHLAPGDRLILKAPQVVFARKLRRGKSFVENPDYLDTGLFERRFYEPAVDLLGESLAGIVFEQEYQRKSEQDKPQDFAARLASFLEAVPRDPRYHVELRTEAYLTPATFKVLDEFGVGQVLSHWTWLPTLWRQLHKGGPSFTNKGNTCVVRLMTPLGVRYADAYKQAFPFDRIVDGMMTPGMIEDAVRVTREALRENVRVNMIVNNRAGGNAPMIARRFAESFLKRIADDNAA